MDFKERFDYSTLPQYKSVIVGEKEQIQAVREFAEKLEMVFREIPNTRYSIMVWKNSDFKTTIGFDQHKATRWIPILGELLYVGLYNQNTGELIPLQGVQTNLDQDHL